MIDDLGAPLANTASRAATTTWRIIFAVEHIRPALSKGRSLTRSHTATLDRSWRRFSRQRNRDVNYNDHDQTEREHCTARHADLSSGSPARIDRSFDRSSSEGFGDISSLSGATETCQIERTELPPDQSPEPLWTLCEALRATRGGWKFQDDSRWIQRTFESRSKQFENSEYVRPSNFLSPGSLQILIKRSFRDIREAASSEMSGEWRIRQLWSCCRCRRMIDGERSRSPRGARDNPKRLLGRYSQWQCVVDEWVVTITRMTRSPNPLAMGITHVTGWSSAVIWAGLFLTRGGFSHWQMVRSLFPTSHFFFFFRVQIATIKCLACTRLWSLASLFGQLVPFSLSSCESTDFRPLGCLPAPPAAMMTKTTMTTGFSVFSSGFGLSRSG